MLLIARFPAYGLGSHPSSLGPGPLPVVMRASLMAALFPANPSPRLSLLSNQIEMDTHGGMPAYNRIRQTCVEHKISALDRGGDGQFPPSHSA